MGCITFDMAQVWKGGFYPGVLEKGLQCEMALTMVLAEMYVQGVSIRKVKSGWSTGKWICIIYAGYRFCVPFIHIAFGNHWSFNSFKAQAQVPNWLLACLRQRFVIRCWPCNRLQILAGTCHHLPHTELQSGDIPRSRRHPPGRGQWYCWRG